MASKRVSLVCIAVAAIALVVTSLSADDLESARSRAADLDRRLATEFRRVRDAMPAEEFLHLSADQHRWSDYREWIASETARIVDLAPRASRFCGRTALLIARDGPEPGSTGTAALSRSTPLRAMPDGLRSR